ncbi:PTS glucose transporter subunit IIA [Buchnera aphidicola (Pseudoregma panicola)]|uniref:PTS glucose transporter subunit IIA n=1 Tax=Buchnera aphidicola TaxID=9 RepID=UPI0031B71E5C
MGIFSNIFGNKKNCENKQTEIFAPLSGEIINIEKVPDIVFSDKIVGDGIAIQPTGNSIVSPVNGKISKIFNTLHAFSIKSDEGIELFVHFGIDTIKLKGKGFEKFANENQKVKIGDLIITFDLPMLKKNAKSVITPVVISNMEKIKKIKKMSGKITSGKTIIMIVEN